MAPAIAECLRKAAASTDPRAVALSMEQDEERDEIGYARYDQGRAQSELSTLFEAQWANGMVPQIVFNPAVLGGYFPEPDFWQAERSPHFPAFTSAIPGNQVWTTRPRGTGPRDPSLSTRVRCLGTRGGISRKAFLDLKDLATRITIGTFTWSTSSVG